MTESQTYILGLVTILAVDLLISASRAALLNASLARLLPQREQRDAQVQRTLALLSALPRLKASLRVAQILLRFAAIGLFLFLLTGSLKMISPLTSLAVLLLAGFLWFIAEWLVESWIGRSPEGWALRLTPLVRFWMLLMRPLAAVAMALAGGEQNQVSETGMVTEDNLITLVDASQEEGTIELDERKMIHSIFELGDTLAREIMVPRIDINALEVRTPLPQALDALHDSGYSRLPVFEESVDHIVGVLYAKDLLEVWRGGQPVESLHGLLRPAYFVPEAKKVDDLLAEMQQQRIHMAIVVDEYGGIAGLVTLEDIVEEILGEIQDEYDEGEELPYEELGEGEYSFQGRVDLDDFNEILDCQLSKDDAETLGGFIYNYFYSYFRRVPAAGESVEVDSVLLTVEQVSGRRIRKVRARRIQVPPDSEEKEIIHVDE